MITIKGKDEAAIVARIEKELKGEDIDIFISEDENTMENAAAYIGHNLKQSRIYMGRLVRNTQKTEEELHIIGELLLPISMYFGRLIEDMYPEHMLPPQVQRNKARVGRYEFLRNKTVEEENADKAERQASAQAMREEAEERRKRATMGHKRNMSIVQEDLIEDFETQKMIAERLKKEGKLPEKE